MNKLEYLNKMDMLSDNNTYTILKKDPVKKITKSLRFAVEVIKL